MKHIKQYHEDIISQIQNVGIAMGQMNQFFQEISINSSGLL